MPCFTQIGVGLIDFKAATSNSDHSDFIRFHRWLNYQNCVVLTGMLSMEMDKSQIVVATVKRSKHQCYSLLYFDVNEPQPPALQSDPITRA